MSRMALIPFHEVDVHFLQVREHCSLLARNHLPKRASFQAPRSRPYQLASKPLTSSDARAISLSVTTRIRDFKAASTAPFTDPVERVAGGFASRADHPRPDPALTPAHGRHRPFAQ